MVKPVLKFPIVRLLFIGLFFSASFSVYAGERLKIGLALSGGGSRGAAHIGVLKELERQRIPIDYIAGTSVGSIIGALYASGMDIGVIEEVITNSNIDEIFQDHQSRKDTSLRRKFDHRIFQLDKQIGVKKGKGDTGGIHSPSGLKQGQKLTLFLDKLFLPVTDINDFDQLPIPFRAVATDIVTSEPIVLGSGNITTAVRASMSIPAVFSAVEYQDHLLVDGGISNNLPIDVVRKMGADVVIAVDIGSPLISKKKLTNALDISLQLTSILVRRTTQEQINSLSPDDILIKPGLGDFSALNFRDSAKIIPLGVTATQDFSEKLEQLALSAGDYHQHYLSRVESGDGQSPVIAFLEVVNDTSLADEFILSKLRQQAGEPLDFARLEKDISILYGMGIFKSVNYTVVQKGGETGLVIHALQKPWGPNYLEFGFSYSSNMSSENNLSFVLGYTVTPTNERNGEWRSIVKLGREQGLFSEYHQPLSMNSPYFVNGQIALTSRIFNEFKDGSKISTSRVDEARVAVALGREYDNWGDFRIGLNQYGSDANLETGIASETVEDTRGGEIFARFRSDTMDHTFFPTSGARSLIRWVNSRADLGADNEFEKGLVDVLGVSTFGGHHTLFLGARYGSTYSGTAPIQNGFRLGGLFDMPGFTENELSGQNVYLLRSAYQRKLSSRFGVSPYVGASLQYGSIAAERENLNLSDGITSASAWLGWKTIIGPVFLGYGYADAGDSSFYLEIGGHF
jgi:NTE family protein